MSDAESNLNSCGCCLGVTALTPESLENPPGLSELLYRVGTHGSFKETMKTGLSRDPALSGLTTRDDDDPSIALLDAWATVLDVLTFYQERIANEGFLRTATERFSVLQLARSIGYELRPGVAASTYLAFELETAAGAPGFAPIDIGTKVQSLPGPDERPQTFETIEKIEARTAWNSMKLRLTQPQAISTAMSQAYVKGLNTSLKVGDPLLIVDAEGKAALVSILQITPDAARQQIRLDLKQNSAAQETTVEKEKSQTKEVRDVRGRLDQKTVELGIMKSHLREGDLEALARTYGWSVDEVKQAVARVRDKREMQPKRIGKEGIFAFKTTAFLFGHNAPDWLGMADATKKAYLGHDFNATADTDREWPFRPGDLKVLDLDSNYPRITAGSWVVVQRPDLKDPIVASVSAAARVVAAGFTMSNGVSRLSLDTSAGPATVEELRKTTVLAESAELDLAGAPISGALEGKTIDLDTMVTDLAAEQIVVVTGERNDLEGVINSEIAVLDDIAHVYGYTTLTLKEDLQHPYKRETVRINANVARATHGESVRSVLGSGDASQAFQKFLLPRAPLTFVSSPTPSGASSTLKVRVNELLWNEVRALYGAGNHEQVYIARIADDGKVTLEFGDGSTGARIPSGIENVVAAYRVGIGRLGMVKAGQLSLLITRPLGVKSVTNPLAATGAADPEPRDKARQNAPFTVRTLDRIVSLDDYEDFARAFAGIGKAQASWLRQGERWIIQVTVAGEDSTPIELTSDLYKNLKFAMAASAVPHQSFVLVPFTPRFFDVTLSVLILPAYISEQVFSSVRRSLLAAFSFEQRSFGQLVREGEVIAVAQGVEGVEAVDLVSQTFQPESVAPTDLLMLNVVTLQEMRR